jgi:hypothetical protein
MVIRRVSDQLQRSTADLTKKRRLFLMGAVAGIAIAIQIATPTFADWGGGSGGDGGASGGGPGTGSGPGSSSGGNGPCAHISKNSAIQLQTVTRRWT